MKKLVLVLCLTVAFVAGFAQAWAQVDTIAPKWVQKGKYAILSPNGEFVAGIRSGKNDIDTISIYKADDGTMLNNFLITPWTHEVYFTNDSKKIQYHETNQIILIDFATGEKSKIDTKFVEDVHPAFGTFIPTQVEDEYFWFARGQYGSSFSRISISQKKLLNDIILPIGDLGYIWHSPDYKFVAFTITHIGPYPSDPTKYHSYIYSTDSLKPVWQSEEGNEFDHVHFCNSRNFCAYNLSSAKFPNLYIRNTEGFSLYKEFPGSSPFYFSNNGQYINAYTTDRITTYHVDTGKMLKVAFPHRYFKNESDIYIDDNNQRAIGISDGGEVICYSFPVTGVSEETSKTAAISVYPSPTSSEINVQWQAEAPYSAVLEVNNTEGKVVLSKKGINALPGINSFALNTSELTSGTYFLRIISGAETKATGKFMVGR